MIKRDKHPVSTLLFGVAAIQAIVGFLGWSIYSPSFAPIDWGITFSFAIFAAFAILARWACVTAALIASVLYVSFLAWQASTSTQILKTGLIFKIPILVLLVVALVFAFSPRKATAQSE